MEIPTRRIVDPNNDDDFIVINESDYDPGKHQLVEREEPVEPTSDEPDNDEDSNGDEDGDGLPGGYSIEAAAGGYYHLIGPEGQIIEGPSNGKWQGRDAVVQAAVHHAEGHAGGE